MFFSNRWHRNYFIRRYLYGPCLRAATRVLYFLRFAIPEASYHLKKPVFIVGVSRSGTTVFIENFKSHADLCDWSEAAQIMDLNFYDRANDHAKTEADVTDFDIFRIRFLFGVKTRLSGKKVFVNKHPENSLRMTFIRQIFPDAIFVHVIRDGRATAYSNYTRTLIDPFRVNWPFGQFPKPKRWRDYLVLPLLAQFSHQWIDVVSEIQNVAREALGSDDYMEVCYEEFCADTHGTLARVDKFCNLNPEKRFYGQIPDRLESQNEKWNKGLSEDQLRLMLSILGPMNESLGYSRGDSVQNAASTTEPEKKAV